MAAKLGVGIVQTRKHNSSVGRLLPPDLPSQPATDGAAKTFPAAERAAVYRPLLDSLQETFGDRLKTVVLFGSQARGDATSTSDHDLLVVAEGLPDHPLARHRTVRMTLRSVLDRLPGAVNFIAKTPAEVTANLTPLLVDVCTDGICLWGPDYFEPLREKALAALRQSGMQRCASRSGWRWLFPRMPRGEWELTWEGYRERA